MGTSAADWQAEENHAHPHRSASGSTLGGGRKVSKSTAGDAGRATDPSMGERRFSSSGTERLSVGDTVQKVIGGSSPKHGHAKDTLIYDPEWHFTRIAVAIITESAPYKISMAFSILFNMVMLIIETDLRAHARTIYWEDTKTTEGFTFVQPKWMQTASNVLLLFYVVDLSFRMYVIRGKFFKATANKFDFAIVSIDCLVFSLEPLQDLPSVAVLRVLRMLRIVRVLRSFLAFRELYLMMQGLVSAIRSIIFATFLIAVVLILWSIMAVEFVHMDNVELADEFVYGDCSEMFCKNAFSSVWLSSLTFLKGIIAGDSWGQLAYPLIIRRPGTSFVLLGSLLMVQLGLLNLIVAVIVDRAAAARENDEELMYTEKQETLEASYTRLRALFNRMDGDGGGTLDLEELQESYNQHAEFREILDLMDIHERDLELVFKILDKDGDEEVSYTEFVEQLHEMKTFNSHTLLIYIKHYAETICEEVAKLSEHVDSRDQELTELRDAVSTVVPDLPPSRVKKKSHSDDISVSERELDTDKEAVTIDVQPISLSRESQDSQGTGLANSNFSEPLKGDKVPLLSVQYHQKTDLEKELFAHSEALACSIRAGMEKAISVAMEHFVEAAVDRTAMAVDKAVSAHNVSEKPIHSQASKSYGGNQVHKPGMHSLPPILRPQDGLDKDELTSEQVELSVQNGKELFEDEEPPIPIGVSVKPMAFDVESEDPGTKPPTLQPPTPAPINLASVNPATPSSAAPEPFYPPVAVLPSSPVYSPNNSPRSPTISGQAAGGPTCPKGIPTARIKPAAAIKEADSSSPPSLPS